jgi:ABC-type branched-subunit amino acid transport system ATPase component
VQTVPMLKVEALQKVYRGGGRFNRRETFRLEADFIVETPQIIGVMGPNGSGKTTLFELITGSNQPTSGAVQFAGQDIHKVRYDERDKLAIHYHQSYQVRHFTKRLPAFLMERAVSPRPLVHLFDEPQFNAQDGYIGFMLDFFGKLRREGKLVFLCVHPQEKFHIEIMKSICNRFMFVRSGTVTQFATFEEVVADENAKAYLGKLAEA